MKPSDTNGCSDFVIFDNVGYYGRVNKSKFLKTLSCGERKTTLLYVL